MAADHAVLVDNDDHRDVTQKTDKAEDDASDCKEDHVFAGVGGGLGGVTA